MEDEVCSSLDRNGITLMHKGEPKMFNKSDFDLFVKYHRRNQKKDKK